MRGDLTNIYAGDPLDANELTGTTRIFVAAPWGLPAGSELNEILGWLIRRLDTHTLSGATVSASLDPYALRALVYLDQDADFTVTNADALPIGYELIVDCYYGGQTIHLGEQEAEYPISCRVTFLKTEAARWITTSEFWHGNEGPPA